ncbi:MAG: hypothetical protein DRP93_07020 [Candidatus Neomarinimicrobiota bacterium]|nr:MAG: hypothetical protein DRP93_07020 [Candidatus Neomarinimicrobiota bacterium]
MPNESIIAVPIDVAEPVQLRRFINKLVEELDLVLGYRGQNKYVASSDLIGADLTLATLASGLASLEEYLETLTGTLTTAESSIEDNATAIAAVEDLHTSTALGAAFYDLDDAGYSALSGRSEFNTLGSNLSNTPYGIAGAETYYNYFICMGTANGGEVQELKGFSTTPLAPTSYFRIGNTWAEALTLGWT